MNIKRSLLVIITLVSFYGVFLALSQSLGEPQIQARLQLYQTNLILHSTELKDEPTSSPRDGFNLSVVANSLIGTNPHAIAQSQYREALEITEKYLEDLEDRQQVISKAIASEIPRQKLKEEISQNQDFIAELKVKLGILAARQDNTELAAEYWQKSTKQELSSLLEHLWYDSSPVPKQAVATIEKDLDGWFRYVALKKIYSLENNENQLLALENQERHFARQAIFKLISLSFIPLVGGMIGLVAIVFLLIQLAIKKENAILSLGENLSWETSWNWETIWLVLVVGFFFLSQVVLPLVLGAVGFNPANFSVRGKALSVLLTYLLLSGGGLSVLYLALKPFMPLGADYFQFRGKNWFAWGIGGYLVAIPAVFIVSILNQQLWHGQGGSNPLLFLALKAQDRVALAIFFCTASIAAPIFEEIMFRGFLLPSLTRYLPVWGAIILSSLVFAFAHLSLAEVLPLATLGVILGFVYTKSRSLLSSIAIHSLWNSGTLLSLFILGSSLE